MAKEHVYLSFDIEADGPSPCNNNMIALGICVLDNNKNIIMKKDYYIDKIDDKKEDKRCMDEFWSKHMDVYNHIIKNSKPADKAISEFYNDYYELTNKYEIEWVASPAAYDWQWVNYYIHKFIDRPEIPYMATCISTFKKILKRLNVDLTALYEVLNNYPLTHNPSDDALRQGIEFIWLKNKLNTI